jgi:tetraacyldisaccharide 4'-kinase
MNFLRFSTFPFTLLYYLVVWCRNKLYDVGFLSSKKYTIPTIGVGNLVVGGAGKSPTIEYLIRLLSPTFNVSTLSRGYGRKTKGFIQANEFSSPIEIGDEPTQFKQKFPLVHVLVSENRQLGMEHLSNDTQVVLLDDAFQHRKVTLGLSILLFDYNALFQKDWLLPMGNMREPISSKSRADIILITKTPKLFSPMERRRVLSFFKTNPKQHLFFSYLNYRNPVPLNSEQTAFDAALATTNTVVLALTGIANPALFLNHISAKNYKNTIPFSFPDHHDFSEKDFQKIKKAFAEITAVQKIILTTEKDAMRLKYSKHYAMIEHLPIYYIPIEAEIHEQDKVKFDQLILKYVRTS